MKRVLLALVLVLSMVGVSEATDGFRGFRGQRGGFGQFDRGFGARNFRTFTQVEFFRGRRVLVTRDAFGRVIDVRPLRRSRRGLLGRLLFGF